MSGELEWSPAPAPGVTPPSPPVPNSRQAAYEEGAKIGDIYGEFDAWVEKLNSMFYSTSITGGIRLWDRMSPEERVKAVSLIQRGVKSLPPLPKPPRAELATALREGFAARRKTSYEASKFLNQAVWVTCELAKLFATSKAATPSPAMIGSIVTRNRDCAAHTASIAIREITGHEVAAERLVKTFGLPPESQLGFHDAVRYTIQWLAGVGIKLAERRGGFAAVREGGRVGRYALFFNRPGGGHIVYGEVTQAELIIIDGQVGKRWNSVWSAQREINGKLEIVHEITTVEIPF